MKLCKQYYITSVFLFIASILFWFLSKNIVATMFTFVPAVIAFLTATVNYRNIKKFEIKAESIIQSRKNSEQFKKEIAELDDLEIKDD